MLISFILNTTGFAGQKELLSFFFSEPSFCVFIFTCQMEDIFYSFPTFSLPHSTDWFWCRKYPWGDFVWYSEHIWHLFSNETVQYSSACRKNFFNCYLSCMAKIQSQRLVLSFENNFSDTKYLVSFQCLDRKSTLI